MEELRRLGFEVLLPEGLDSRRRFAAGTVERRAAELRALLLDDGVAGIVCARGGAGAGALVEAVAEAARASRPKAFLGYSDATALHLLLARLGRVGFHGPMVAWEFASGGYDEASLRAALTGEGEPLAVGPAAGLRALRPGLAEGRLLGGCLSLLASAAGTPWALETSGEPTVLFLEDVDERPYRLDRMLLQLRASGALAGVVGVVFGRMPGCDVPAGADYCLEDVLLDALGGLEVPVAIGLPSGHLGASTTAAAEAPAGVGPATAPDESAPAALTLPLGVRARLECGEGEARLDVLEPSVA